MERETSDPGTDTRKSDDAVGSKGAPAAAGGHQSAEQAAITDMGGGGKDDAARREDWSKGGEPGVSPPALGGSSSGHSDQTASRGPEADRKVAGGLSRAERENDR